VFQPGRPHGRYERVAVADLLAAGPGTKPVQPAKLMTYWAAEQIGVSPRWLLVGGPLGGVGWAARSGGETGELELQGQEAFGVVWDADLWHGQVLVLAMRSAGKRGWAPRGGIGWLGTIPRSGEGLAGRRAIFRDPAGPGAPTFNRCGPLQLTTGAFLADGEIALVPGAADGVYLYSSAGKLERAWTSDQAGLDTGCDLSAKERRTVMASGRPRARWQDQRRIADDVISFPGGRFAVVRRWVEVAKVHWDLRVFDPNGTVTTVRLPMTAEAGGDHWVRMKAAVEGRRIALLAVDSQLDAMDRTEPSRLWVGAIRNAKARTGGDKPAAGSRGAGKGKVAAPGG